MKKEANPLNNKKKKGKKTHKATWDSSSSESKSENDGCNIAVDCLMASIEDESLDEVSIYSLSKDELSEIIKKASSKLKTNGEKHKEGPTL